MAVNKGRVIVFLMLLPVLLTGQTGVDQRVSVTFSNETIQDALLKLDSLTDLRLSYNPQILPSEVRISKSFQSTLPEHIVKDILGNTYQTKYISDYLIIQKAPVMKQEKVTYEIKGGVRDASTGEELQDVTIYEVNSLKSTLTNSDGEFSLLAETNFEIATFAVSKRFYRDTVIQVDRRRPIQEQIVLRREKEKEKEKTGTPVRERVKVFTTGLAKFFTSDKIRTNASNVNFVDTRLFQMSLIPSVGTNLKMSSQIRNKISINILAGYSYGVKGVEVGGFYNIDREEVRGAQFGGFGNTVGGEVHGVQAGGFVNTTDDYVDGVQVAGFVNVASDSVEGFQAAGFTNITRGMKGFQAAGFNNHTKEVSGFQAAGFVNTTGSMKGFQAAGFVNIAKQVNGMQVSVVNLADSVGSGIQLGLINIAKKNGFISPALESNDFIPYQFAFRSGLEYFYTVLFAGRHPDYWSYGVGFGSRLFLSEKSHLFFNPELRWANLAKGKEGENESNNVIKLDLNLGYKFFRRLSVSGGPTLNFYYTNRLNESGIPVINVAGNTMVDELTGNYRYQLWIGYALRVGF